MSRNGRTSLRALVPSGVVLCILGVAPAYAVDGVKLLKQPGSFPIVISEPGSYRLKGNLVVPDANTTAIRITVANVTIDLNGFTILGPTVCDDDGACAPTGGGQGITTPGNAGSREGVTVRNGTIQGMGSDGVSLSEFSVVEHLRAISNGNNGIYAGFGGRIVGNVASRNGNRGIAAGPGAVISGNVVEGNYIGINGGGFGTGTIASNVVRGNRAHGIICWSGVVVDNLVSRNGFGPGGGTPSPGITAIQGSRVFGNSVVNNARVGIEMTSGSAYGNNVLDGNNGGNGNPQASGGVQLGPNVCGGDTICP
jgi:hypothetical protein